MSMKADRYSAKNEVDEFEGITERLSADLRKSIRSLENFPILSDAWLEMAEVFGRLANVSDMESKLPSAKKDATLWETEEQAMRFLLEDGKLNLCLRSLIDFKVAQTKARKAERGAMIDFATECDKFEKGLGTTLRNAWLHVEVIQTTDLPAMLNHIINVLEGAIDLPVVMGTLVAQGDLHQRQEVLVFYYISGLIKHIDEVGENRLMPVLRERGFFMKAVQAILLYGLGLLKVHKLKMVEALSQIAETEYFGTYRSQFIDTANSAHIEKLLELKELFLNDLMTEFENRKVVRPLNDCVEKAKRLTKK